MLILVGNFGTHYNFIIDHELFNQWLILTEYVQWFL